MSELTPAQCSGKVVTLPAGERTPAGGVAFVFYYFTADGEPLPNDHGAAVAEIHELDEDGIPMHRTYGTIEPSSD